MNTEGHQIKVGGVTVQVVRKAIKNLHLGVYPPNGRVRVAAPLAVNDEAVRLAVVGKLGWIKRQRARFESQPRQTVREMVSGESHYYLGNRYRLRVVTGTGRIHFPKKTIMEMQVPSGSSLETRKRLLDDFYRASLRTLISTLLDKWEDKLGVSLAGWRITRMKTRWGGCNPDTRRIWLNLELAKKPVECIEYIIVHEMAHLIDRHHNDRFVKIMDKHMPHWRLHRQALNAAPLGNEQWLY